MFEILDGPDYHSATFDFGSETLEYIPDRPYGGPFNDTTVDLYENIKKLEKINEENYKKEGTKIFWGSLGYLTFGTTGLLWGLLFGSSKKEKHEVVFYCELRSGEKFIARCDTDTYLDFRILAASCDVYEEE